MLSRATLLAGMPVVILVPLLALPSAADVAAAAVPDTRHAMATAPGRDSERGTRSYVPPVPGPVAQRFDPPEHAWEPGHRGVDLWSARGAVVVSPGNGVVTYTGSVAGKPVVVVTHPDGLRSSLEPVEATVPRGTVVRAGDPVGELSRAPGGASNPDHCAALAAPADDAACAHWGVRRGDAYVDPLSLLGAAAPIVLLPPA